MEQELDGEPQEQAPYVEPPLTGSWMLTAICVLLVVCVIPIAIPGVIALGLGVAMLFGPFGFVLGVGGVLATGLAVWACVTAYRIAHRSNRLFAAGCCAVIEIAAWTVILVGGSHLAFAPRPLTVIFIVVSAILLMFVVVAALRERMPVAADASQE